MNRLTQRKQEWRSELPPTLEAVERFCLDFQHWRAIACDELDAFATELLLREALTNSVVHGSEKHAGQRISCVLRAKPGRLLIAIQDQGEGFDWRAALARNPGLSDTSGRGMGILRRYASAVRFNLKGNAVTLVKRF